MSLKMHQASKIGQMKTENGHFVQSLEQEQQMYNCFNYWLKQMFIK